MLPAEVVVVEDGPITPKTGDVLKKYTSVLNIKRLALPKNVGLASALNQGLKKCQFDLVARMDADDVAYSNRFSLQVNYMQQNPDIVASSCVVDEIGFDEAFVCKRMVPTEHEKILTFSKLRSPLNHPAAIFRKKIVERVGGYPLFHKGQDYALWSLLLVKLPIVKLAR